MCWCAVKKLLTLNKRSTYQRRLTNVEVVADWHCHSIAAQGSSAHSPRNGLWTRSDAASRHTTPRPATLGLNPVIHVPNYMHYYSFTDLWPLANTRHWSHYRSGPCVSSSTTTTTWRHSSSLALTTFRPVVNISPNSFSFVTFSRNSHLYTTFTLHTY